MTTSNNFENFPRHRATPLIFLADVAYVDGSKLEECIVDLEEFLKDKIKDYKIMHLDHKSSIFGTGIAILFTSEEDADYYLVMLSS